MKIKEQLHFGLNIDANAEKKWGVAGKFGRHLQLSNTYKENVVFREENSIP